MPIRVYWWKNVFNFGDWLTPYLLEKWGLHFEYASLRSAQLISVGSTLSMTLNVFDLLWRAKKLVVLGSGLMFNPQWSMTYYLRLQFLDIRLVRGELTKMALLKFIQRNIPCGDPGLLASSFYNKELVAKAYSVGLIPHHSRYEQFAKLTLPIGWRLIDPRTSKCEAVFENICQCELIMSESLHGLVVADSFEIPNVWLYNTDLHVGGDFKFRDYFSSIDRSPSLCYRVEDLSEIVTVTPSHLFRQSFQMNPKKLQGIKETILGEFNRYAQSKVF